MSQSDITSTSSSLEAPLYKVFFCLRGANLRGHPSFKTLLNWADTRVGGGGGGYSHMFSIYIYMPKIPLCRMQVYNHMRL